MRCAKCDTENRETAKFCDKCGAQLSRKCASCGAENRPDAKFCDACGAALERSGGVAKKFDGPEIPRTTSAVDETLEGERKIVTALFADLKGSTALMENLDPEAAHAIVDPALRIMVEAVRRYEGHVARTTGDGIFALFGAPVAYEDHPQTSAVCRA